MNYKKNNEPIRQCMVFAAGLGTRLKPLTNTKPKALVEINGKPLIEHVIDKLVKADFNRIVVNVHHFAPMIIDWISSHTFEGVEILISDESEQLLDTGGGLRKAANLFVDNIPILIHNVDIISNIDLKRLYDAHCENDATLLVSQRVTSRYLLFDSNMQLRGWKNIKTNEVKSPYPTLNTTDYKMLAFSGIHVFSPRLFKYMTEMPEKFGIIDFYLKMCKDYKIVGYEKNDIHLLDVGKIDSLNKAEEFLHQ